MINCFKIMSVKKRILIIESDDEEEDLPIIKKISKEPKKKLEQIINETTQFVAPKKTMIVNGEWVCNSVPCTVISRNDTEIIIKPFNKARNYNINIDVFNKYFESLNRDESFVYVKGYPDGKINIKEFGISPISINELCKHFDKNPSFVQLLEKAYQDSYVGKGNTFCINMQKYKDFISNNNSSKLERIGDAIFNRTSRHTFPIPSTFTRDEFENCESFPAPIGIRAEDFAFPSEQNDILKELLTQIFNCVNAPECPESFKNKLGISIIPNSHMCEWCGSLMDILELNQTYCSKEHSVNFCHRDPVIGTKKGNVYIGHCSCNREQGGYSEEQRIQQLIRLAKYNPKYRNLILDALA